MKILITGSTAPQASSRTASRVSTFASMIAEALTRDGNEVDFIEPSFALNKSYLSEYDLVLVGIAPPTSLSANKIYPAFAMANRARELGNLAVFIDAPDPYKIPASLKSCYLNISDLQKEFYSRRKQYRIFSSDPELAEEVYQFVEYLHRNVWPTTLYPALPWSQSSAITSVIPNIEEEKLFGINLDYQIFEESSVAPETFNDYWASDYPQNKWTKQTTATLSNEVRPIRASKWDSKETISETLTRSIGLLASVHRASEPWWSPYIAKSLSLGRPVVTDWRYSSLLGVPWAVLASTVEDMDSSQKSSLALAQAELYKESTERGKETLARALDKAVSQTYFSYN